LNNQQQVLSFAEPFACLGILREYVQPKSLLNNQQQVLSFAEPFACLGILREYVQPKSLC
jgi:hypothetical protein